MLHRRTLLHRLFAGFAALVMAFAALAPAVASALGRSTPVMWVELCSAQGIKRVAVDVAGSPLPEVAGRDASDNEAPATPGATGEHCPFCHLQSAALDLPPATGATTTRVLPQHTPYPARFYTAPRPSHAWAPTRSRAPPQHA